MGFQRDPRGNRSPPGDYDQGLEADMGPGPGAPILWAQDQGPGQRDDGPGPGIRNEQGPASPGTRTSELQARAREGRERTTLGQGGAPASAHRLKTHMQNVSHVWPLWPIMSQGPKVQKVTQDPRLPRPQLAQKADALSLGLLISSSSSHYAHPPRGSSRPACNANASDVR